VKIEEEKVTYNGRKIDLYETKLSEVQEFLGPVYDTISWNSFSYEFRFRRGVVSVSHKQNDSLKIIRWFNASVRGNRININDELVIKNTTLVENIANSFGCNNWSYDSTYADLVLECDYIDLVILLKDEDFEYLRSASFNEDDWKATLSHFRRNRILSVEAY